ncbi:MAG TPA: ABC transporter permease [Actinomycetales bacterium]|jgi:ABC-2 type transport system permease protein
MSAPTAAAATARGPRPTSAAARPSRQFAALAGAMLRSFFRDRTALFFTFFFPLMFLVVFGLIFGGSSGGSATRIGVVGDGPLLRSLPREVLTPVPYDSLDEGVAAVRRGDLPAVVEQQGDRLVLRYAASDTLTAAVVQGVLSGVVDRSNVAATGQPPRSTLEPARVEDSSLRPIQFTTGGILSWGVATSAAFGAALTIVSWRKKQLLRRIRLSPAPVWTVVAARVGVSLVVALVQAVVFVAVALTPPFGLQLAAQWWLAVPVLICGTLAFLSIGLLVGSIAKTEEAASAMANFVVLPMAFLSGAFFDISQAPAWLRAVSRLFPLRHMNDAMLDVIARGQGVGSIVVPCAVLLAFAAVLAGIATRVFRWDDA